MRETWWWTCRELYDRLHIVDLTCDMMPMFVSTAVGDVFASHFSMDFTTLGDAHLALECIWHGAAACDNHTSVSFLHFRQHIYIHNAPCFASNIMHYAPRFIVACYAHLLLLLLLWFHFGVRWCNYDFRGSLLIRVWYVWALLSIRISRFVGCESCFILFQSHIEKLWAIPGPSKPRARSFSFVCAASASFASFASLVSLVSLLGRPWWSTMGWSLV